MSGAFSRANAAVKLSHICELRGVVTDVTGLIIEGSGPFVPVGSDVEVRSGVQRILAQVVGFRKDRVLLMAYGELQGIAPGATIVASGAGAEVLVSDELLGRAIDGMGNPIDGGEALESGEPCPLFRDPHNPVTRRRIEKCFDLGVRAINGMLTVGSGQRMGIFSGSGVGKSTLMGMVAKHSRSDVNVIALVGERGREVREFIERDLGPEGMKRSVVVVATGNQSALLRIRAAYVATAIAEYFRDEGKQVVLMLDSVTRLAMAQREIGLAIGEPPNTRGYTPSVFAMLPKLLERAGTCSEEGSITALYTVLVEGDDMNEPVADAVRGILDGHIVLSRRLAGRGHYPAIEVLESVSRVMSEIVPPEVIQAAAQVREMIATYRDAEDLITIGAYKPGQNPRVDRAVQTHDRIEAFLKQSATASIQLENAWAELLSLTAAPAAGGEQ